MCVSELWMRELCVCVRELCVTKLVGRRAGGGWGVHNNKQEPHTKMWGRPRVAHGYICINYRYLNYRYCR